MNVGVGLGVVLLAFVVQPFGVAALSRHRGALRVLLRQPPPPSPPERWWTPLVTKWWRRLWGLSAAILLAVVGVVMSEDAAAMAGLGWLRGTASLAALLLGYVGVGAIVEMGAVIWRVTRQHEWRVHRRALEWHIVLSALSTGLGLYGVGLVAAAIAD